MGRHARRALVTGAAGFIGSHLVERLLAEGWSVTAVDNFDPFYDPAAKRRNIASHLVHPAYTLRRVDIRDLAALQCQLQPGAPGNPAAYDVIVHLAARPGVRASLADPVTCQQVNVIGTQNLLELARQWGVRQFVFASSSSVYGGNPNLPWREDDPALRPISPYASSKLSGELLGYVYTHLYGIRFIALRLFTVYGPRQRPDLAVHKFARLLLAGEAIPIYGDGSARRDFTYVDDVVDGIRAAMDYDRSDYEVINLGNDRPVAVLEMVRALEEVLERRARLRFLPPQPGDVPATHADLEKARRLLGYQPTTDLRAGLRQFAAWLKQGESPVAPADRA